MTDLRTYGEDLHCVFKHIGSGNLHFHETAEKIGAHSPDVASKHKIEHDINRGYEIREKLLEKFGKMSKQEAYSCARCDEDLGAQLRNTYKDKEQNTILDSSDVNYDIYKEYKSEDNSMIDQAIASVSNSIGVASDVIKGGVLGGGLGYIADKGLDVPLSVMGAKLTKLGIGALSIGSLIALKNKLGNVGKNTLFFNGVYLIYRGIDPTMGSLMSGFNKVKEFATSFQNGGLQSIKDTLMRSRDQIAAKIPLPQIPSGAEPEHVAVEAPESPSFSPSQSKGYDKLKIF